MITIYHLSNSYEVVRFPSPAQSSCPKAVEWLPGISSSQNKGSNRVEDTPSPISTTNSTTLMTGGL